MPNVKFSDLPKKFRQSIRTEFSQYNQHRDLKPIDQYGFFVEDKLKTLNYEVTFHDAKTDRYDDDWFEFTEESYFLFLLQFS